MGCAPSVDASRRNSNLAIRDAPNHYPDIEMGPHTSGKSKKRVLTSGATTEPDTNKGSREVVTYFGPMQLRQQVMSILLVFPKDDSQLHTLTSAAQKGNFRYHTAHGHDDAIDLYFKHQHDVVFIDHRHPKVIQAPTLCKSLHANKNSEFSAIVAVTKKHGADKEEPSIMPLLQSGFTRRFVESSNVSVCVNELCMLEHGEVATRIKLRACQALFTALDHSSEPVEISNSNHEIQYVNPAYERLTGFVSDEILGKDVNQMTRYKPETCDIINSTLNMGNSWDGPCFVKKKNGDNVSHVFHITPVLDDSSNLQHYVSIRRPSSDLPHRPDKARESVTPLSNGAIKFLAMARKAILKDVLVPLPPRTRRLLRKHSEIVRPMYRNGDLVHHTGRRRESIARIHSLTIEAPITQVINIINAAQESSPVSVVEALNKVLDILRSSELYSPYFVSQNLKEDQMTTDLVGGLVSQGIKRRFSANDVIIPKTAHHPSTLHPHIPATTRTLSEVPENVQQVLSCETRWDFSIIDLELHSNNHPLVYLGLTAFAKYGVCQFLEISETVLQNWLTLIEANYHPTNSYHNATHAADVVHAISYFLERDRAKNIFEQMEEVVLLLSAAIHDVDHPGRNNAFMINSSNPLAILYNDIAVLESHHASTAFNLTSRDDAVNIFKNVIGEDYKSLRRMIVDTVLATEMSKHFEHVSKFINCVNKGVLKMDDIGDDEIEIDDEVLQQLQTTENKMYIRRMLIKCADIANPTRPLDLCKQWASRITDEYCKQTDEEKEKGYPVVMPIFDRLTCSIPKCQTSFVDVFINDTFDALDYFLDVPELIEHRELNYVYWKEQEEIEALERLRQQSISLSNDNIDDPDHADPVHDNADLDTDDLKTGDPISDMAIDTDTTDQNIDAKNSTLDPNLVSDDPDSRPDPVLVSDPVSSTQRERVSEKREDT